MRSIFLISILGVFPALLAAQVAPEIGVLNSAKFRIDVPAKWNGGLIVYCHGYSQRPGSFDDKPNALVSAFTDLGYAVAQSGYAAGGWAVKEGSEDTEQLRRYFISKYVSAARPLKETFLMGHSMGGFLTMMSMERMAGTYKAGLALCGPLTSSTDFMNRGAFDGLVLFNYYFPGVLPEPDQMLKFQEWQGIETRVMAALQGKPEAAETLRRFGGQKTLKDFASVLVFGAGMIREMTVRAGGLAFENADVVYTVEGDYNAVNTGVKRYRADPKAAAYVASWYTPTGRLTAPMLAVHTTYDPLVPTSIPNRYIGLTRVSGSQSLFVQQYVKHDGHCQITPAETVNAFQELKRWADGGPAPVGGTVPAAP